MTKKQTREIANQLSDLILTTSGKPIRDAQQLGNMLVATAVSLAVARLGPSQAMEWISFSVNEAMETWQQR